MIVGESNYIENITYLYPSVRVLHLRICAILSAFVFFFFYVQFFFTFDLQYQLYHDNRERHDDKNTC